MKLGKREWDGWAESIMKVKDDLQSTVNDREVFRGFRDVIRENEVWIDAHEGGHFCQFVLRSYVARIVLGVRRQIKNQAESISLKRILSQMQDCAPQITFDFYLQRFPRDPEYVPWQEPTFKYVSADGKVASTQIIADDLEEVERLTKKVEEFVDRTVAHLDKRGSDGLTFNELDEAIDTLDRIAVRYICFLTGQYRDTLKATIQFDWKRIFSVPFREPAEALANR